LGAFHYGNTLADCANSSCFLDPRIRVEKDLEQKDFNQGDSGFRPFGRLPVRIGFYCFFPFLQVPFGAGDHSPSLVENQKKKQRNKTRKVRTMQLTIEHGMQSVTIARPEGTTVGALLQDPNIKAVVGFGDAVTPIVDGSTVDNSYELSDGDTITLQARAAVKAA
jgi:hypothetical protein